MPFISKDWRSPGEEWVKTQEGWEKKKVLECTAQRSGDGEEGDKSTNEAVSRIPPHCHITIKCTREIAGFNGLSEAVRRLDFSSAVRDVRRFNYICALLELLLHGQRLTHLPGAAQKLLLSMLEQLADQVAQSQQNLNALRALLSGVSALREAERRSCWGRPLGSRALWGHHDHAIARIHHIASAIRIQEPGPEVVPKLHDLPEECIRDILLRLADHRDLDAASSAWSVMSSVCSEQRIWRELVSFHFTNQQIDAAVAKIKEDDKEVEWKKIFHHLRKFIELVAELTGLNPGVLLTLALAGAMLRKIYHRIGKATHRRSGEKLSGLCLWLNLLVEPFVASGGFGEDDDRCLQYLKAPLMDREDP